MKLDLICPVDQWRKAICEGILGRVFCFPYPMRPAGSAPKIKAGIGTDERTAKNCIKMLKNGKNGSDEGQMSVREDNRRSGPTL